MPDSLTGNTRENRTHIYADFLSPPVSFHSVVGVNGLYHTYTRNVLHEVVEGNIAVHRETAIWARSKPVKQPKYSSKDW